jgi:RNA polymerase sigma-B factor
METLSARKVGAPDTGRFPLTLASTTSRDLDRLEDAELLRIVRSLPHTSERREAACELLVSRHRGLVRSCVNRYRRSPEPTEDLMQVGYVGLLKAINNFDPAMGPSLAAYAQPCISGEIKRYFRDKRWHVHVERPVQELLLEVRAAKNQLIQQLGHAPSEAEISTYLGSTEAAVREALRADMLMQPSSLDAPLAGQPDAATLADLLGADDPGMEHTLSMQALGTHWDELPRREQTLLLMRFYGDMTQAEIGSRLGISQMHVSRLLAHALTFLRERILCQSDYAAAPELAASA